MTHLSALLEPPAHLGDCCEVAQPARLFGDGSSGARDGSASAWEHHLVHALNLTTRDLDEELARGDSSGPVGFSTATHRPVSAFCRNEDTVRIGISEHERFVSRAVGQIEDDRGGERGA